MGTILLLAQKDLRTLARSRVLLAMLFAYPLVIALLLGSMLLSATESAKIALVNEDDTGKELVIGESSFGIDRYRKQAEQAGVDIVDMDRDDAMHALEEGQVQGVMVITPGFMAKLNTALSPADIEFYTGDNALGTVITQRVRGVIYKVNLTISKALIDYNAEYLKMLVTGGEVEVLDQSFDLYGLDPAKRDMIDMRQRVGPADQEVIDEIVGFADDAGMALELADNALDATAAPVRLKHLENKGKSPKLTARAMSFALAVSIAFICVILVAASLAAERDEHVLGRLVRSLASPLQVVLGKLVLGAALAALFSIGIFVMFAMLAPQAWTRLPLLLVSVIVASLAFSTIGTLLATLTRDARTATLVGILIVLPMIPLGLIPANTLADTLSAVLPFDASQAVFNASLYEMHPLRPLLSGYAHLLAIALVPGVISLRLVRRLI